MGQLASDVGRKVLAIAVLLVAAYILFKIAVGVASAIIWTLVAIAALVAVIWALSRLL